MNNVYKKGEFSIHVTDDMYREIHAFIARPPTKDLVGTAGPKAVYQVRGCRKVGAALCKGGPYLAPDSDGNKDDYQDWQPGKTGKNRGGTPGFFY